MTDVTADARNLPANRNGNSKPPVGFGVRLQNLDEAWRLSQALSLAATMPRDLRGKPSDILAVLLRGQELGLGPMQSIDEIAIVEGGPSLSARLWRALAIRAGHAVDMVAQEHNKSCTVRVTRGDDGRQHEATYTIDDAVQGGRATVKDGQIRARSQNGKPLSWETVTDDMLTARASARAVRFLCPEVALGFYVTEELTDEPELAPAPEVGPTSAPAQIEAPVEDAEVLPEPTDEEIAAHVRELEEEALGSAAEPDTDWPPVKQPGSGA